MTQSYSSTMTKTKAKSLLTCDMFWCIESQLIVNPFTTPTALFKRRRKPVTSPKSRKAICHAEAQALTTLDYCMLDLKQWLLYHPCFKHPPLKCNHKRCIEEVSGWKNTWSPTRKIVCISHCHAAHFSWEDGIFPSGIDIDMYHLHL